MKNIFTYFTFAFIMAQSNIVAAQQTDCKYAVEDKTPGEELKTTPDYLMYEYSLGTSSEFIFFSLSNTQGIPVLNFQLLSKAKDFPKMYCLEKESRMYIQLANNKIVTMLFAGDDQCAQLIYDDKAANNLRTLTGPFLFIKGSMEDLVSAPISFIRVKYVGETKDYPINTELKSGTMNQVYKPDSYFIENLKCVQ